MKSKAFFKAALLHSGVIWLLLQMSDIINYTFNNMNVGEGGFTTAIANRFVNHNVYQTIWVDVILLCFIVEFNWNVVFHKYRFSALKFIAASFALSVLFTGLHLLHDMVFTKLLFNPIYFTTPLLYLLYTGAYIFIRNYFEANKLKAEQIQQNTRAQLNTLKAQLNPHFFFNTLSNIYGTALMENASNTADAIDKLSSLVRYTMDAVTTEETPIINEVDFINDYFLLQLMRLPKRNNIFIQKEILCDDDNVKANSNYVTIYEKQKKTITRITLTELLQKLPAEKFVRVNKSVIVAIDKIEKIEGTRLLINNTEIRISENYREQFFKAIVQ